MKSKFKIKYAWLLIFLINLFYNQSALAEISKFKLQADIIKYLDNNDTIVAEKKAYAIDQFGKEISAETFIYNKNKLTIQTLKNSVFKDNKGNEIFADNFFYDLAKKKIEAINNVIFKDKLGNNFLFSSFTFYENSEKGFGENMSGILADGSSMESEYAEIDNLQGFTVITNKKKDSFIKKIKNIFNKNNNKYTTCLIKKEDVKKNIQDRCPDWSISTTRTSHNTNKKMVQHQHAIIKIKNIPVFYTPYFSHPDPSVKRKSGFLTPSTKNFKNLGRTFKIPYFYEVSENSDLTLTPILYQDENPIFLTEYRNQNKNGKLYIDTSFNKGYKNLNKLDKDGNSLNRTSGSRNHLFINYAGNYENILFKNNDININIQRISQKNYLRVNEINTYYVTQDTTSLVNNVTLNSFEKNKKLSISGNIFEDINNENKNTKYQYTLPSIEYNDYFNMYNAYFNLNNKIEFKNLGGDSNQINQINKLTINSKELIVKKIGLGNILRSNLINTNTYNQEVVSEKENTNNDAIGIFALETLYPLIKINENNEQTIFPKIFTKFTTGKMREISNSINTLTYNDIFLMDRMNNETNPERGLSLGYGAEYKFDKRNKLNKQVFTGISVSMGQVIKNKEYNEIPSNSSLDKKRSNIVGDIGFYFNNETNKNLKMSKDEEIFSKNPTSSGIVANYSYNLTDNFDKILKNQLSLDINNKKNKLNLSYYELHDLGNAQTISGSFKRYFENGINLGLGISKDLENKFTQSNFIETNYESDCLKIGLSLSKQFYNNQDLKPENKLNFYVMLKPFGQPFAPDLTNLINDN